MRYAMKQRLFTFGDKYNITDGDGTDVYYVDGKAISFGKQLSFQDMEQRELAFIKQKPLNWGATYEIWHNGELQAVVKKELFTFFHCVFHVDEPGADALTADGQLQRPRLRVHARRPAGRDGLEGVVHVRGHVRRRDRRARKIRCSSWRARS